MATSVPQFHSIKAYLGKATKKNSSNNILKQKHILTHTNRITGYSFGTQFWVDTSSRRTLITSQVPSYLLRYSGYIRVHNLSIRTRIVQNVYRITPPLSIKSNMHNKHEHIRGMFRYMNVTEVRSLKVNILWCSSLSIKTFLVYPPYKFATYKFVRILKVFTPLCLTQTLDMLDNFKPKPIILKEKNSWIIECLLTTLYGTYDGLHA